MIRNYLTVARRILMRSPVYSGINIGGLAVGIAAALLITLFVMDERGFDRHHEKGDRIARLTRATSALSAAPMGPALSEGMPGVEASTRIEVEEDVVFMTEDGERFTERLILAEPAFFDMFSHEFLAGSSATALDRPNGLVISAPLARRLFGTDDALGRSVTALADGDSFEWEVTGVIEQVPRQSHFTYSAVASFEIIAQASSRMENWTTNWLYTYLLLSEPAQNAAVSERLQTFMETESGEDLAPFRLMPLTDIHLKSDVGYEIDPQGSMGLLMGLSAVAILILLIACANFTNMAVARASRRASEIGMRKALGAHRRQLVMLFMGEAVLLVTIAAAAAAALTVLALPAFNGLAGREMVAADLMTAPVLLTFLVVLVLVSLVGGGYPSWALARLRPIESIRGRAGVSGGRGVLRHALVVGQFAISMFLVIGTLSVYNQIRFMQDMDLGFTRDAQLIVRFGDDTLEERPETVRQRFAAVPDVRAVSFSGNVPGENVSDFLYRPEGWTRPDDLPGWDTYFVDGSFLESMEIEVVRGRAFDPDRAADGSAFMINEAAARVLAAEAGEKWSDPVGRSIDFLVPGSSGWETLSTGPIIGVARDFHYLSLHSEIQPLVLQVRPGAWDTAILSVTSGNLTSTVETVRKAYKSLGSDAPFDFTFLDRHLDALYESEVRTARLVSWFSGLAILIACLGLFAVSAYAAAGRSREIGIRKVFGASALGLAGRFVRRYAVMVLVAGVAAVPAALILVDRWLRTFAYRAELDPLLVGAGAGLTLVLAVLTVAYHAVRTAGVNPAVVLRQP